MMIMHEPDKKTRRKWLSEPLLHFSEPADWRGGRQGREKKKKVYFYSGIGAGWMFVVSRTPGTMVLEHGCGEGQCSGLLLLLPKHPLS